MSGMTFFQTQVDKFTTVIFNKWIWFIGFLVAGIGFSKDDLLMIGVKSIQECAIKGLL